MNNAKIFENLQKLKKKWVLKTQKGKKYSACLYKAKYYWLLRRAVKLAECDCVRY